LANSVDAGARLTVSSVFSLTLLPHPPMNKAVMTARTARMYPNPLFIIISVPPKHIATRFLLAEFKSFLGVSQIDNIDDIYNIHRNNK
jgi:hypothetical protein